MTHCPGKQRTPEGVEGDINWVFAQSLCSRGRSQKSARGFLSRLLPLQEAGEKLEDVLKERQAWAKDH